MFNPILELFEAFVERNRDVLLLLGRILLMLLFISSGWGKLMDYSGTSGYMTAVGAPLPQLAAIVAIVMELGVGVALVLGVFTRPLALLMALFILGTAILGHPFWNMEGAERLMNLTQFQKNLSIVGGLLLLAVTGPGRFALQPRN